jgi:hypothetical protein
MHLRLKDKTLSDPILKEMGFLLNHAEVFVKQTEYDRKKKTLFLNLNRYPVIKKTGFSKTKHSKEAINCDVVIRKIEECNIENIAQELEAITIIFGLHFENDRIYFCSAQEGRGKPCFSIDCKVSEFDIEITDIKDFANQ